VFDVFENFDHYCILDNVEISSMSYKELQNILSLPRSNQFLTDLQFRYLLLDIDWLYNGGFLLATNFIAALLNILDIDDYEKREILERMINEDCPIVMKFKMIARNIDEYPLNESDVDLASKLYSEIPKKIKKDIQRVISLNDKINGLDVIAST
jgi:hypothetical protein